MSTFVAFKDVDPLQTIVASNLPEKGECFHCIDGTVQHAKKVVGGACFASHWYSDSRLVYQHVRCEEHARMELVPSGNYDSDLQYWYDAGLHPRFSIFKTLRGMKQNLSECRWRVLTPGGRWNQPEETKKMLRALLENLHTPEEFLKAIDDRIFVYMSVRGRRLRVTQEFKRKWKARVFTPADFLNEANQELRRFMLRRGVEPRDILASMTLIAEDEEGKIYESGANRWDAVRYLYVKCPSTGQEYFLAIPRDLATPKEARRWTFNLPKEAEFVKEA